jgi:O-antigen ligase
LASKGNLAPAGMLSSRRARADPRRLGWLVAPAGSLLLGWLVGYQGAALGALLLAIACMAVLVLVFRRLLLPALLVWIPLGVVAFPWLRIPRQQQLITFDRAWVGAAVLAAVLAGSSPTAPRSVWARRLSIAVGCLALAFTARIALTLLTTGDDAGVRAVLLDAVLLPVGLFFVARRVTSSPGRFRLLAGAFTLAGAALAVIGIAERIWGFELASLSGGAARYDTFVRIVRISGPYGVPEVFALNLTLCFAATLYWTQARRGAARMLGVAAAVLEAVAIGLTLFRAAWLAGILALIATVVTRRDLSTRVAGMAAVVSGVLLGLYLFGGSGVLSERLGDSRNVYGRFAAYQEGWAIFRGAPLAGIGVNQFRLAQEQAPDLAVNGVPALTSPHSTFISVLVEQGLLGFSALVALGLVVWLLLRDLRRRSRDREELLALGALRGAAAAYLVMSLTLTMWPYGSSNAFFLILLGAAAGRAEALQGEEA